MVHDGDQWNLMDQEDIISDLIDQSHFILDKKSKELSYVDDSKCYYKI